MTFREKLKKEHPKYIGEQYWAGCKQCPCDYGYEEIPASEHCENMRCSDCWNREIPTEKTYEEGLQDAWELANKIFDMDYNETVEVFNCDTCDVMKMKPQEALAKLKAYEEAQEIKVGDVVETNFYKFVVIFVDDINVNGIDEHGGFYSCGIEECRKTGKHIDIESLLGQIRGE